MILSFFIPAVTDPRFPSQTLVSLTDPCLPHRPLFLSTNPMAPGTCSAVAAESASTQPQLDPQLKTGAHLQASTHPQNTGAYPQTAGIYLQPTVHPQGLQAAIQPGLLAASSANPIFGTCRRAIHASNWMPDLL